MSDTQILVTNLFEIMLTRVCFKINALATSMLLMYATKYGLGQHLKYVNMETLPELLKVSCCFLRGAGSLLFQGRKGV